MLIEQSALCRRGRHELAASLPGGRVVDSGSMLSTTGTPNQRDLVKGRTRGDFRKAFLGQISHLRNLPDMLSRANHGCGGVSCCESSGGAFRFWLAGARWGMPGRCGK